MALAKAISKAAKRLTDRQVAAAKCGGSSPIMLHDGYGLYLRVAPSGSKSWIYRYKISGKQHDIGLGPARLRPLAEARKLAMELELLRLGGGDPLANRRVEQRQHAPVKTFREVAEEWIAAKGSPWSEKHHINVVGSLVGHAYDVIGDMPIGEVDTKAVMSVIGPKWQETTETMSRVRSRIEAVLGFAETAGYRDPGNNPARWGKHLSNLLPKRADVAPPEKLRAMTWANLPAFMAELRTVDGLIARSLEFTILTAARTGEVIGARWSEIDLEGAVWTIPASRMKAGREHRVPLTAPALAILAALPRAHEGAPRGGELVFPRLVSNSMIRLLNKLPVDKTTVHGFRATFRTWGQDHDRPRDIVEMALAHNIGSKVEQSYARSDLLAQRRRLADDWAAHCDGIEPGKVVKLRA